MFGYFPQQKQKKRSSIAVEPSKGRHRTISEFFRDVLPDEFGEEPWYILFLKRAIAKHKYICFLSSKYKTMKRKSMRWVMCIGRVINVLFIDTILNVLVVDNNNMCGTYTTQIDCEAPRNLNFQDPLCAWGSDTDDDFAIPYCSYNDPSDSYTSALIITFLVVIASAPLDALVEYLAAHCIVDTTSRSERIPNDQGTIRNSVSMKEGSSRGNILVDFINSIRRNDNNTNRSSGKRLSRAVVPAVASSHEGPHNSENSCDRDHEEDDDELRVLQSKESKVMIAARLVIMQKNIDDVTPHQEFVRMTSIVDTMITTQSLPQSMEVVSALKAYRKERVTIADITDIDLLLHESNQLRTTGTTSDLLLLRTAMLKKINYARDLSKTIVEDMRQITIDMDKDNFLMKHFLVESLVGTKRLIARRYFFDSDELESDDRKKFKKIISVILLPLYLIGCLFYVYLYGVQLGPSTTNIWLAALAFDLAQDIIILQPMLIFCHFTLMSFIIQEEVRRLHDSLIARVKIVMRRTKGVLLNTSELIQHLNPACRAARKFPELMVSRLLLSLNDYDFPSDVTNVAANRHVIIRVCLALISLFGFAIAIIITFLPDMFQETFVNVVVSGGISYIIVMTATMDTEDFSILISFLIVFFILLIVWEYRLHYQRVAAKELRDKERAARVDAEKNDNKYILKSKKKMPSMEPSHDDETATKSKQNNRSRSFGVSSIVKPTLTTDPKEMNNNNNNNNSNSNNVDHSSMAVINSIFKANRAKASAEAKAGVETNGKKTETYDKDLNIPIVDGPPIPIQPGR